MLDCAVLDRCKEILAINITSSESLSSHSLICDHGNSSYEHKNFGGKIIYCISQQDFQPLCCTRTGGRRILTPYLRKWKDTNTEFAPGYLSRDSAFDCVVQKITTRLKVII